MSHQFRSRLSQGEKLLGTIVSLTSPSVAEILADVGYDWLFIDGEHGPFELGDLQAILQAVHQKSACVVRVPSNSEASIKRVLDIGADGIIVPQVNTAEQAEQIVSYARYAPEGMRGVGIGRAHGYGRHFQEYVKSANEEITVIVQAEHRLAVENIESIVKVKGIDAVLLGPYDLSASYNKLGQIQDPEVVQAIDHVTTTCLNAKIPLGMFGLTPASVQTWADKGYTLLICSVDTLLLSSAAENVLGQMRAF